MKTTKEAFGILQFIRHNGVVSELKLRTLQARSLLTKSTATDRKIGLGVLMVLSKTARTLDSYVFPSDHFRGTQNRKVQQNGLTPPKKVNSNREETSTGDQDE